jgi:hypothetical protein
MTDPNNRRQENMEQARRAHEVLTEFDMFINEAMIKSADAAVRTCLLINGGAAIAVLAFMGTVFSKDEKSHKIIANITAGGLTDFAYGVIAAVVAMGLIYVVHFLTVRHTRSQNQGWEPPYVTPGRRTRLWGWLKNTLHVVAALVALFSAVMFVCGLFAVRDAVTSL